MEHQQTKEHDFEKNLPSSIDKWNWGAFFFSWIWAISNRVWIGLLCFIPVVGLIMRFILGANGNEWAWEAKKWRSVEHFERVQKKWADAAGVICVILVIGIIAIVSIATDSSQQTYDTYDTYEEPSTEINLGAEGMSYGNVSFSIDEWYDLGQTLEEREVNPRVFWNPIVTNGKYVIVVVEIQNKGTSEEFITSNSFKLTDQDGREYYLTPLIPSTSYNDFTFYDNNNQPVRVHDHIAQNLPLTTAIKPGIPTTFGLIFEVAKDTDSINLVFMTS